MFPAIAGLNETGICLPPLKVRGFQSPVLEIGAGMSQYVAGLLPPSGEQYLYLELMYQELPWKRQHN
jgi:hypothetical protein